MIDELITLLDVNGDGVDESQLLFDENGVCTIISDFDYDEDVEQLTYISGTDFWGNPTDVLVMVDTDNDGNFDSGFLNYADEYGNLVAHGEFKDYDQDGQIDMAVMYFDSNSDGLFDVVTSIHSNSSDSPTLQTMDINLDQTGDQIPDVTLHTAVIDTTDDGHPDIVRISLTDSYGQEFSYEMPYDKYLEALGGDENSDLYFTPTYFPDYTEDATQFNPSSSDPDLVSGDPASDMEHWEYQGLTKRCAIYAQKFVIEEALGREIPIDELVVVAEEHGWINEAAGRGTTPLNMDKLLEYYGVEHKMSFNNDIKDIEVALIEGKNVIVGVDSGQIWYGNPNNIFSPETQADHAVQVIGIDHSNPENPMVILNDSGTPNGRGEMVPLNVFENAWNASDSQMIICMA